MHFIFSSVVRVSEGENKINSLREVVWRGVVETKTFQSHLSLTKREDILMKLGDDSFINKCIELFFLNVKATNHHDSRMKSEMFK